MLYNTKITFARILNEVGKNGVNDNKVKQLIDALEAREIIKFFPKNEYKKILWAWAFNEVIHIICFTALAIAGTIGVVKIIDDFIIQPTIYSDRVQAHPLEVFLCILIAGYIGGIWGMLFAIPLYTVLRVFAREFFSEYSLVQKLTHQMTE